MGSSIQSLSSTRLSLRIWVINFYSAGVSIKKRIRLRPTAAYNIGICIFLSCAAVIVAAASYLALIIG